MEEAPQKNESIQEQDSSPENNLQHPNAPESDSATTDKSSEVFLFKLRETSKRRRGLLLGLWYPKRNRASS